MSTLKVGAIRGTAASSDAITVNATDGTCTAKVTNNLSNRNLIINGAMQVAQRGTTTTSTGYQTLDRWFINWGGTDESPTVAQLALTDSDTGPWAKGFRNALQITNGNQTSGAGAGDDITIQTKLEAQDIANCGWDYTNTSSYITLQFWIKSSVAQNFYGRVQSNDGTKKNYPFETGALSVNTWTKVTKTIPGVSGIQFDNNTGTGFILYLSPFEGTNNTGSGATLNTWATFDSAARTPDNTSTWYTTNDSTYAITGVQLEVGDVATEFEHKSFRAELQDCLRYFEKSYPYGSALGSTSHDGAYQCGSSQVTCTNTTGRTMGTRITYRVHKRNNPTATIYDLAGNSGKLYRHSYGSAGANDQSADAGNWSDTGFNMYSEGTHSATGWQAHWIADSEL